jgi:hypothetical protein
MGTCNFIGYIMVLAVA